MNSCTFCKTFQKTAELAGKLPANGIYTFENDDSTPEVFTSLYEDLRTEFFETSPSDHVSVDLVPVSW